MIKQYFVDGLVQFAIVLSLLRTDVSNYFDRNYINYPEVQEIVLGQTSGYTLANFRNVPVLNAIDIHWNRIPKSVINDDESLRILRQFSTFHRPFETNIDAFLADHEQIATRPFDRSVALLHYNTQTQTAEETVGTVVTEAVNPNDTVESPVEISNADLSFEDMDLIEVLWRQDLDLGVGREFFDANLRAELEREREVELQKQRIQAYEHELQQFKFQEQQGQQAHQWLNDNFYQDGETGEYIQTSGPSNNSSLQNSEYQDFTFDEAFEILDRVASSVPPVEHTYGDGSLVQSPEDASSPTHSTDSHYLNDDGLYYRDSNGATMAFPNLPLNAPIDGEFVNRSDSYEAYSNELFQDFQQNANAFLSQSNSTLSDLLHAVTDVDVDEFLPAQYGSSFNYSLLPNADGANATYPLPDASTITALTGINATFGVTDVNSTFVLADHSEAFAPSDMNMTFAPLTNTNGSHDDGIVFGVMKDTFDDINTESLNSSNLDLDHVTLQTLTSQSENERGGNGTNLFPGVVSEVDRSQLTNRVTPSIDHERGSIVFLNNVSELSVSHIEDSVKISLPIDADPGLMNCSNFLSDLSSDFDVSPTTTDISGNSILSSSQSHLYSSSLIGFDPMTDVMDEDDTSNDSALSLMTSLSSSHTTNSTDEAPFGGILGATGGSDNGSNQKHIKSEPTDDTYAKRNDAKYDNGYSEGETNSTFSTNSSDSERMCIQPVNLNHSYPLAPVDKPHHITSKRRKKNTSSHNEGQIRELPLPYTVHEISDSSVERFSEMLTNRRLSKAQVQLMRDIRRRSKNKIAAQNCRKRKIVELDELGDELGQLQRQKRQLELEHLDLVRDTCDLKRDMNNLYEVTFRSLRDADGRPYDPERYVLQQAPNGEMLLVPWDSTSSTAKPHPRRGTRHNQT